MQLTDAEIREILLREKRRKRRRQQMRRRRTIFILFLLIIAIAVAVVVAGKLKDKGDKAAASANVTPPRGTIFIDPGHGGEDPGSDNGARFEKDDTLRLALATVSYLEDAGFKVALSRTDDQTIDRTRRGEMANEYAAKLMVSIHRNKSDGSGEGVEAFIPTSATPDASLLAQNILHSLAAQGFAERTVRAGTLQSETENYEELGAAQMPCCLVEVGFLDNANDNALFDNNLEANAKAIADAIEQTFIALYEPDKLTPETETQTEPAADADAAAATESAAEADPAATTEEAAPADAQQ